jgi:ABC-type glycerol-3-phosphate transport system substrate-binding protein
LDLDERRSLLALGPAAVLAGGLASCSVKDNTSPSGGSSSGPGSVSGDITFLTFETPNLSAAYWDAAIKRVTDRYSGIKVKKLVAPPRTAVPTTRSSSCSPASSRTS